MRYQELSTGQKAITENKKETLGGRGGPTRHETPQKEARARLVSAETEEGKVFRNIMTIHLPKETFLGFGQLGVRNQEKEQHQSRKNLIMAERVSILKEKEEKKGGGKSIQRIGKKSPERKVRRSEDFYRNEGGSALRGVLATTNGAKVDRTGFGAEGN